MPLELFFQMVGLLSAALILIKEFQGFLSILKQTIPIFCSGKIFVVQEKNFYGIFMLSLFHFLQPPLLLLTI